MKKKDEIEKERARRIDLSAAIELFPNIYKRDINLLIQNVDFINLQDKLHQC